MMRKWSPMQNDSGVTIRDIRKPKPRNEWQIFSGRILNINTPRSNGIEN